MWERVRWFGLVLAFPGGLPFGSLCLPWAGAGRLLGGAFAAPCTAFAGLWAVRGAGPPLLAALPRRPAIACLGALKVCRPGPLRRLRPSAAAASVGLGPTGSPSAPGCSPLRLRAAALRFSRSRPPLRGSLPPALSQRAAVPLAGPLARPSGPGCGLRASPLRRLVPCRGSSIAPGRRGACGPPWAAMPPRRFFPPHLLLDTLNPRCYAGHKCTGIASGAGTTVGSYPALLHKI